MKLKKRVAMENFVNFVYLKTYCRWPFGKPENYRKIIKFLLPIGSLILFWKIFLSYCHKKTLRRINYARKLDMKSFTKSAS